MQFKVPQNIDLEDKIVGPLTLIQFLYVLAGAIIVYTLFQTLFISSPALFWLLSIPIALVSTGLAFVKIQDQPLAHFIVAGIAYLTSPKVRLWLREGEHEPVLAAAVKTKKAEALDYRKHIEKSQLEQLAYSLDTQPLNPKESKKIGQISSIYEKLLKEGGINGLREKPNTGTQKPAVAAQHAESH